MTLIGFHFRAKALRFAMSDGDHVVRALKKVGFEVARQRESYVFTKHPDGRGTVVSIHGGETLGITPIGGELPLAGSIRCFTWNSNSVAGGFCGPDRPIKRYLSTQQSSP